MNKEEIFDLCEKYTQKEKIQFIYTDIQKEDININRFDIDKTEIKENSKLNIKVIVNGQTAQTSISKINKIEIENAIKTAKKIAKFKNNIKIKDFGSDKSNAKIKFDKKIKEYNISTLVPELKENIYKQKYIKGYMGSISKSSMELFYINPHINYESESYGVESTAIVNTKNKKDSSAHYWNEFTRAQDIDITGTFDQARLNAFNLMDPVQGKKDEYDIVLIPEHTQSLLDTFVINGTQGNLIQKKKSYLRNSLNKKVYSNNLTIIENPILDYFNGSRVIDDEGFKTKNKYIIKDGVFKTAIYDQEDALRYNKKPTGNGFSEDTQHTNLLQKPGSKNINNIIKNIDKGILVYQILGLHTSNLTNGEFTSTISSGIEINNGELGNSITNLNLTGNMKDIFNKVYFSKEQKFFGNGLWSFGIIPKIKLI